MANGFGLSINPADFGIAQPPDQGSQETEQMLRNLNAQGPPDPLAQLRDLGARLTAQAKMAESEQAPPFGKVSFNSDGTIDASGIPADTIRDLFQARDFQREALGGFHQQAQQISQELQRAQAQPWQQLATALAANMANQREMPPWVRGLGQTAAQMNPTVDQLRAQYLGVLGRGSQIAEKVVAESIAQERTALEDKRLTQGIERETMRELANIEGQGAKAAKEGTFDAPTHYKQLRLMGVPDPIAQASAARLAKVNETSVVDKAIGEALKDKRDEDKFKRQLQLTERLEAGRNARQEAGFAHSLELLEARQAEKDAAQREKDKVLPKEIDTKMADVTAARLAASELMTTLNDPKAQKLFGPVMGRFTDLKSAIGTLSAEDAKIVAKIRLQFANTVKTLEAGAFGYRISERPFLLTFSEAMKNNPQQNIGNLQEWLDFFDRKEEGYRIAFPKGDFSKFDKTRAEARAMIPGGVGFAPAHSAAGPPSDATFMEMIKTGKKVEAPDGRRWQLQGDKIVQVK